MALNLVFTNAGRAALVNAANTGTGPTQIAQVGVTATAFVAAAGMTALPGELKRLDTFAGAAVADDVIHISVADQSADIYDFRGYGLYLSDGTLLALYGQADPILEKAAVSTVLLAADITLTSIEAAEISFGDASWINPPATEAVAGVVRLASDAEAVAAIASQRAVSPKGLKASLDDRFGAGAPSGFIKGLLGLASAALVRAGLGLGSAAVRNEGAGGGLDADKLDGADGSYYRDRDNHTGTQGIASVTGLQGALDGKSVLGHGHSIVEIGGLPAVLDGKANKHWADFTGGAVFGAGAARLQMYGIDAAAWTRLVPRNADNTAWDTGAYFGWDHAARTWRFAARPLFGEATPWDSANFDPATKANTAGQLFTGEILAPGIHARSADLTSGWATLSPGSSDLPGYIRFSLPDGTPVGYIGWQYGLSELEIRGQSGWTYRFSDRPRFGEATPWDSANFNPALKADLAGATFTGPVNFGANSTNYFPATPGGFFALSGKTTTDAQLSVAMGYDGSNRRFYINRWNPATGAYLENLVFFGQDGVVDVVGADGLRVAGHQAWHAGNLDPAAIVPAGTVAHTARATAPAGWIKANGAAISRTTYAALFDAIGTAYGAGDGSTTFNLPDLRGEFLRGLDDGRGIDAGRDLGSAQADELKSHSHDHGLYVGSTPSAGTGAVCGASSYVDELGSATQATGGAETRPRNIALLTIIKY